MTGLSSDTSPARPAADATPSDSRNERKRSVLAETTASRTSSIAEASMLKDLDLFTVAGTDGRIPLEDGHGLGLYHRDCRYVCGYAFMLGEHPPQALASATHEGAHARFQLVNMQMRCLGGTTADPHQLSMVIDRQLDGVRRELTDHVTLRNYGAEEIAVPITIDLVARFEDVFAVRGQVEQPEGTAHPPRRDGHLLRFARTGIDGRERRLVVELPEQASGTEELEEGARIRLVLRVPASGKSQFDIVLRIDDDDEDSGDERTERLEDVRRLSAALRSGDILHVDTNSHYLQDTVDQSLRDLAMLTDVWNHNAFLSAGLPWFATLFGRDSSIAALQLIDFCPELAADTARVLAAHQGSEYDEWRDEEPGKILHELRRDELTACDRLPYSPYYGSVDATSLFLILVAEHHRVVGEPALFRELRPAVDAALEWTQQRSAQHEHGLLAYTSEIDGRPIQKGWRDSTDGVVMSTGDVAPSPVSLIEVQAYAWRAWRELATILDAEGDSAGAADLRRRAEALHRTVHDRFVCDRLDGTYAMALCGEGHVLSDVASSNPGHALWCGIASDDVAAATARHLLSDQMFSGWGIRTLGSDEHAYNPVSYHRGSVWPHDNAICAAGLRRYGYDEEAMRVIEAILTAAHHFESHRLPELFAGHKRSAFPIPVRYPVACHPQAWASGSVPMLLRTSLGLEVDGAARQVRFRRPMLPLNADRLTIGGIRVGGEEIQARFERIAEDAPHARLVQIEAPDGVDVQVIAAD